jgi:two-component system CheB/CheR fusion protein
MGEEIESQPTSPEATQDAELGTSRLIVGVGASAGGIDALKRMFTHVEPGCGMAFVVVLHLDPDHGSVLSEIVARSSPLPVKEIGDHTPVQTDHVYVIPPNATLTIEDGHLLLARPVVATSRGHRNTIDEFFTSLARDRGENAACVILSGTGSDGTIGLRAIKEAGGLTVAQAGAEYDGMMRSAVATGLVDFVLPAEEIPAKLSDYFGRVTGADASKSQSEAADQIAPIIALLRGHTGHDFSGYKDRTIIRRVQRRMHVLQIEDPAEFLGRLKKDPREATLLFNDLLIGVTNFFRDPEVFAALETEVISELFRNKGPDDTVRVWVPGCATGEEAYSIAVLLRDGAPKSQAAPKVQIFATDIDESALETARRGRYPASIAKDIPPPRLERYFLREDGTYRIGSDLREICLFSVHNLLRDPPFSKLDLISCRNLLIYLGGELQGRIIPLFHYALNQNGFLLLGTSENVTRHSRLFGPVDKKHRIFRRRAHMERQVPEFPLTALDSRHHRPPRHPRHDVVVEPSLKTVAERQLIDQFAPAYVVVNAEGDALHSSGRTGKYLELLPGAPDLNIFNMARPGLRLELRAALHKATGAGRTAVRSKVMLGINGGRQEINLSVQSLEFESPPDRLYMIVFQEIGPIAPPSDVETLSNDQVEGGTLHQLEEELRTTRERLQTTTEELESSNEELKSGNEELQSINEELQSANEELETSKEELQSINEELQTVNAELNARVEELSRANNDMNNLLESTQIATVFLDRTLAVKSFTPAAKDIFRLVESDAGRPIMHVRARFDCDTLREDAERVLRTLSRIERPVQSNENDTRYIMRMLPYRTADNVINGVVLTFTDVTDISAAEAQIARLTADLHARITELETLLDLVPVGVMLADERAGVLINTYGGRLLGKEDSSRGLTPLPAPYRLFEGDRELAAEDYPLQRARRTGRAVPQWQGRLETAGGHSTHVMISATPLFGDDGHVRGAIAAIVDMTAHKQAEDHQKLLLSELQHRVKNILATVSSLASRMSKSYPSIVSCKNQRSGPDPRSVGRRDIR